MSNWAFGVTMIIVGMGGTVAVLVAIPLFMIVLAEMKNNGVVLRKCGITGAYTIPSRYRIILP